MSAYHASGVMQWLAADPGGTQYPLTCTDEATGRVFRPTAFKFKWTGLGSSVDQESITTHLRAGHGFASGLAARRCVAIQDQDAVPTTVCTTAQFTDCVAATVTSTPARDGALDIDSISDTGFALISDDPPPVNIAVAWDAWGGKGVVGVIGDITEPAATGDQDYSVPGFDAAGNGDQVVFIAGIQQTAADTVSRNNAGLAFGVTTGVSSQNNVIASVDADNVSTTDGRRYCRGDECLAMITLAGGMARATLTQFNTDGFRLNWLERTTTGRLYIFLAIKGGRWQAGSVTVNGRFFGAIGTVTGLPFRPMVALGFSANIPEVPAGSPSASGTAHIYGIATIGGIQRGQSCDTRYLAGDANINLTIDYDAFLPILVFDTVRFDVRLREFTADGFSIIWEGDEANNQDLWHGYVAWSQGPIRFLLT